MNLKMSSLTSLVFVVVKTNTTEFQRTCLLLDYCTPKSEVKMSCSRSISYCYNKKYFLYTLKHFNRIRSLTSYLKFKQNKELAPSVPICLDTPDTKNYNHQRKIRSKILIFLNCTNT